MVVQSAVLAFSSLLVLNRRGCRCFGRFCSGRFTGASVGSSPPNLEAPAWAHGQHVHRHTKLLNTRQNVLDSEISTSTAKDAWAGGNS